MKRVDVYLPDELDKKFREVVRKLYGNRRGALSIAVEQAIRDWIKKLKGRKNEAFSNGQTPSSKGS